MTFFKQMQVLPAPYRCKRRESREKVIEGDMYVVCD